MEKRRNRRKRKQGSRIFSELVKNATREGYAFYFIVNKLVKELTEALYCYGPESLEVAGLRHRSAMFYHKAGKLNIAIGLMEKAVDTYWAELEYDDPCLIGGQVNLSDMYLEAGRGEEAARELEDALNVIEHNVHPEYPSPADILRKLAQAYQMEGQDWPAIELYLELLEMEENALGHGHPGLAHRQWDLAVAYYEAGLTAKAIQVLQESIEMNLASAPRCSSSLAKAYWYLAQNYAELGCAREALNLSEEVLASGFKAYGAAHTDNARTLEFQGSLHLQLGEWEQARAKWKEAYLIFWKAYGAEHEDTQRVKEKLGELTV